MLGFRASSGRATAVSASPTSWWQRRHHLTHVGYVAHIFSDWLALGGRFVFLCLALAIVMGLARKLPNLWWRLRPHLHRSRAAPRVPQSVSPYDPPSQRTAAVRAAAVRLERIEHVRHIPVVVENVHDVTSLPNAEATGLGLSRRVVLWDTM